MILFNEIKGWYCENQGYQHYLDNHLQIDGWEIEDLGESSTSSMHVYGLHRDLDTKKPIIYLQSGIHGNEFPPVFFSRRFAEWISRPEKAPGDTKHLFEYLKNKYAFYWIPIANPYGYEHQTRDNEFMNINVDFQDETQKETLIIKKLNERIKPVISIDCHNWERDNSTPCHKMAIYQDGYRNKFFHREISNNALKSLSLISNENVMEYPFNDHGGRHFHVWSGAQKGINGQYVVSWLIETSRMRTPEVQTREGINAMLVFCLQSDVWLFKSIQNPTLIDIM
ncbi:hypothetical protein [Oceanobacillus jeddahense]|uniref:hypothetical protein n=1 Tax=Oceanobacillus jeddahense TaxID=1462527 RepID=UPI000595C181|nr:hypothetical protein [Oceanobacillus jeddahense]